ncbi:hypothetical protein EVAR_14253_1 [Eumeta japonica]|uniref:Uncharacterized protein n=1 Tax=Eumeta variegata TaxID=151549 RepID=A0A4C1WB68_EUMVA|nr:hypothetical protein EVAR_14253_1 [Eumeta japonica]
MAANVNERLILEWLMEEDGNSSGSSSNDEEEYTVEQSAPCQSPHESESEQDHSEVDAEHDMSSSDEDMLLSALASYQSRNGTKWSKLSPPTTRKRSHNIVSRPPGALGIAKDAKTALQSFNLFLI